MTTLLAGLVAFYASIHGDMTAIAARQGVDVPPGHVCIAHWDRERLGQTGTLYIGARDWPVIVCDYTAPQDLDTVHERQIIAEVPYAIAAQVPGFVGEGLWPGILVFGGEAWPHQPL